MSDVRFSFCTLLYFPFLVNNYFTFFRNFLGTCQEEFRTSYPYVPVRTQLARSWEEHRLYRTNLLIYYLTGKVVKPFFWINRLWLTATGSLFSI
jgi:hypothetical protein